MKTVQWNKVKEFEEIIYEKHNSIAKVTINRQEKRSALLPLTVNEMIKDFSYASNESKIGIIILTGQGEKPIRSGGDQSVRGHCGYVGTDEVQRLNVLDLQRLIRTIPKPVISMVAGYAIGGGHVLHVVSDLTIAVVICVFCHICQRVGCFVCGFFSSNLCNWFDNL